MEKIKIDIPTSVYDEWVDLFEISGHMVKFRKKLRYQELVDVAAEYAQHVCVIDTDAQIAYEANETDKVKDYLILKHCSNIDVEAQDDPMSYAAEIMEMIYDGGVSYYDICNVSRGLSMGEWFAVNTIDIYNKYHNVGTKICKAFGGLLDGGDLIKQLAESRGLNEQMIDFVQSVQKPDDNITLFKQFAKKPE